MPSIMPSEMRELRDVGTRRGLVPKEEFPEIEYPCTLESTVQLLECPNESSLGSMRENIRGCPWYLRLLGKAGNHGVPS